MIEHAATKIGLIGLGEQGLRIVQHLEACGFALGVYDKDPDCLANAGTFFEQQNVLLMASTKQMLELGYTIVLVVVPEASMEAVFKELLAIARAINLQDLLLCSSGFAPISHVTANLTPKDEQKCCGLRFVDLHPQDSMFVGDFSLLNEAGCRILEALSGINISPVDGSFAVRHTFADGDDVGAFVAALSPGLSWLKLTFGCSDKFRAFATVIQPSKPAACKRIASGWCRIVFERVYACHSRTGRLASTPFETYQNPAHRNALEPAESLCQLVELNLSYAHLCRKDILALESALRCGALPSLRAIEISHGVHRTLGIGWGMRRAMSKLQTACNRDPDKPIQLDVVSRLGSLKCGIARHCGRKRY